MLLKSDKIVPFTFFLADALTVTPVGRWSFTYSSNQVFAVCSDDYIDKNEFSFLSILMLNCISSPAFNFEE